MHCPEYLEKVGARGMVMAADCSDRVRSHTGFRKLSELCSQMGSRLWIRHYKRGGDPPPTLDTAIAVRDTCSSLWSPMYIRESFITVSPEVWQPF
jgi:hypothetical protein